MLRKRLKIKISLTAGIRSPRSILLINHSGQTERFRHHRRIADNDYLFPIVFLSFWLAKIDRPTKTDQLDPVVFLASSSSPHFHILFSIFFFEFSESTGKF